MTKLSTGLCIGMPMPHTHLCNYKEYCIFYLPSTCHAGFHVWYLPYNTLFLSIVGRAIQGRHDIHIIYLPVLLDFRLIHM